MALTRGFVKNAATTPLDTRLMDAGLVASNTDGSARTGVLGYLPSIVSTNGDTSPMSLSVAPAPFIVSKGLADGITRPTNDGVTKVPIAAAPGTAGTSRYDVLWVKHNDDTTGDANALPIFGVTSGAAASSPTEPALAAGQERLGALRIYSGTTSTSGGGNVFTNNYKMTAAEGAAVPFRTLAELNGWTTAREGQLARIGTSHGLWERDASAGVWRPLFAVSMDYSATEPVLASSAVTTLSVAPSLVAGSVSSPLASEFLTPKVGGFTVVREGIYRIESRVTATVAGARQSLNARNFLDVIAGGRSRRLNAFGGPAEDDLTTPSAQWRLLAGAAINLQNFQSSGAGRTWTTELTVTYLGPLS